MKKSILVILLSAVCFCVFYGIRYMENPVKTQAAIAEVYEQKIDTVGYIVRSEQVYNAPASGTIYHYVQEGTKVSRNSPLSTVYTGEISEATLQELNNINKKITRLSQAVIRTLSHLRVIPTRKISRISRIKLSKPRVMTISRKSANIRRRLTRS